MSKAINWFVAEGSAGFTSDPEQAKKINGYPIACPGGLNQVWRRHFAADKAKVDLVWELLLDTMETQAILVDEDNNEANNTRLEGAMEGIVKALALLTEGNTEEESLKWVRREADRRYDE